MAAMYACVFQRSNEQSLDERIQETLQVASYLENEVPPCMGAIESSFAPCEMRDSFGLPGLIPASIELPETPPMLHSWLVNKRADREDYDDADMLGVTHIVLRGLMKKDTTRCAAYPIIFPLWVDPENEFALTEEVFLEHGVGDMRHLLCYTDVAVYEYFVGTGPAELTLMHSSDGIPFSVNTDRESYDIAVKDIKDRIARSFEGSEWILWLAPPYTNALEGWAILSYMDVQRYPDNDIYAVSPFKRHYEPTPENLALLEFPLVDFRTQIRDAHESRLASASGRIAEGENIPMLVTDANLLSSYFNEIGAYDGPIPTPAPPLAPGADDPWAPATRVDDSQDYATPEPEPMPDHELLPSAPFNLEATTTNPALKGTSAEKSSVTLTWEAPHDSSVTLYGIFRKSAEGSEFKEWGTKLADAGSTMNEHIDTAFVEPGAVYDYHVRAMNSHGFGPPSEPVRITIPQNP